MTLPAKCGVYRVFIADLRCFRTLTLLSLCGSIIKFKPHKNKRLPAASCTETSWIATIFPKSDRFIQPDSRCVLRYDFQLYLQVSRFLRAFDARKRKSFPDSATPIGFFNSNAKVYTVTNLFLVTNRINARCSGNPAVNERRNFDVIFCFRCAPSKILLSLGR